MVPSTVANVDTENTELSRVETSIVSKLTTTAELPLQWKMSPETHC